jgi:predicted choloylglycine hydrolase
MGEQHGRQLASQIEFLHERYLNVYLGTGARRFLALTAAKAFESQFLPEHRDELQGLAQETGMDEREAALAQCFLDLSPMSACSTITLPASAAPDHVARFGRDLDFPSLNVADRYSTVFIFHPEGRYQFVAIGWPGMLGVLSGMNEHGLALANMEITRSPRLPTAMPYTLLYRSVLEQCKTVREAIDYLDRTPRQTSNNLMLMDASGDRAVVEITPSQITLRRATDDAALISTNHQRGADCDTAGRCKRFDYLHDTAEKSFGHVDQKALQDMLAHVAQGKSNLQSMIFEPVDRVIWLSTGARAASGTFYRLDLQPYFAAKGPIVALSPAAATANQDHAAKQ